MKSASATPRIVPRWIIFIGLWLLLSSIFASQLFLAGYVTPWSSAFAAEAVYWLAWGILAPAVFWWCAWLRRRSVVIRVAGLLLGAVATAALEPLVSHFLGYVQEWLGLCVGECQHALAQFRAPWLTRALRVAGVNLPVYAGIALAWHAAAYYRESRDRQLQAMELESSLHQAQLQALRSQLNPHFLFNVLHSIAELVHGNPQLAERMIVRLGELLRQVLKSSTLQEVPLAEELDFIRSYIEIEQMRLGERLQVKWDVQPEALQSKVPSLILQPLVENAIQHGVAPTTQACELTIRAAHEAGFLHLQVRDSGPGMGRGSQERCAGIGLSNTRIRLQRMYGDRQRFDLLDEQGLSVNLRIPLLAS